MTNRDHYTMDHFEVHLGSNNNAQLAAGSHHPHFDHYGSWNYLHGKMHALIDVVQPAHMSANVMDMRMTDDVLPCPTGKPPTHLDPIKIWRGENAEIAWKLRSELPFLTKTEISDYRNSYYQNLCLCMLSLGYHRAFTEIFHLVGRQETARRHAGPDSLLWSLTPLSMQEDKLALLKECLSAAEDYFRVLDYRGQLKSYARLAKFFKQYPEDKWLVDHFLRYCWRVSKKITNDSSWKHAESNYYLGMAIEQNKEYTEAFGYFFTLYELARNRDWMNEEKKLLFLEACEYLARIRVAQCNQEVQEVIKNEEMNQKIDMLREALDFAKESTNKKLEGLCAYKLGQAYEDIDKFDVALNYLGQFYDISKGLHDNEDVCQACEALANVYRKQRKFDECLRYMDEFVNVAEQDPHMIVTFTRACRAIGDLYNQLGKFDKASEYFRRAFYQSRSQPNIPVDLEVVEEARVLFGVSQGNNMNLTFNDHVQTNDNHSVRSLIEWKRDCKVDNSKVSHPIPNKEVEVVNRRVRRNIFESIGTYPKL